ncbi:hypothetical protein RhiirA5_351969 [Rhizophagus irregularis]|uniref:Uncharacterized protein n=2 Tax=Rhizophagus irregularis TaxID=588596 RepID=A0A2I1F688_9GLOM|nr:hypothetical protein RhiirA5_351969 [Rhizophagus irregularis]PKK75133.1 hypothetical protein RhiirC2_737288 [Rhizophagus irregularis]PKY29894.1 hypothetical protein RhiirB3_418368 [Rhizophagus irregularis]
MITILITVQKQKLQRSIHHEEVQFIADLHHKAQRLMYIHIFQNHIIIILSLQHIHIIIIMTNVVMMPIANNISKQKGIVLILITHEEVLLVLNFGYD